MTTDEELYVGREQTLVKHFILKKYLQRFALIVGRYRDVLTYIDCFSGPWNARSGDFQDSSFAIALRELRNARDVLAKNQGRTVKLRCFFLEKDPTAYARLKLFADAVPDAEIATRNSTLEDSIKEIVEFVGRGGAKSFPFIFIDPTGWTGFRMQTIAPLLRVNPGEVLINFMTGHIRRFLDSPQEGTQESFEGLFGSGGFRDKVDGVNKEDRDDAVVKEYTSNARRVGEFRYGCSAVVLHPEKASTHFHLIYLTRHHAGVGAFKDIEKKAMEVQEAARAEAQQEKRQSRAGQLELLGSKVLHDSSHYNSLRERYLEKTRSLVLEELEAKRRLSYDTAWTLALSEPLSWESDLKRWIRDWESEGRLRLVGLKSRERVPKFGKGHFLVWDPGSGAVVHDI